MLSIFPSNRNNTGQSEQSKLAMVTVPSFRKKRTTWPEPEQSTGRHLKSFGSKSCWEAIGPARQKFLSLGAEIRQYLEQCSEPIPSWVTWSVYMVGKSKESAEPTIIFCSDATCNRRQIRKIVKQSGLLEKYPGFATGDMAQPPDFNRLVLVGGTSDRKDKEESSESDLEQAISEKDIHGLRITVSSSDPNVVEQQKATAGGLIVLGARCFYMTACHPFEKKLIQASLESDGASSQYSFDDDEDSEDDELEAEDVDFLSRGSITPDQDSLRRSFSSNESSPPSTLVWDSPELQPKSDQLPYSELGSPVLPNLEHANLCKEVLIGRKPGEVYLTSNDGPHRELDYALLSFHANEQNTDDKVFQYNHFTFGQYTDAKWFQFDGVDVYALKASGKQAVGKLSGTPTFIRVPTSDSFQEVYVASFDSCLEQGDCGTWVVERKSGKLIGHIIAGCTTNNIAYLIPAYQIFKDIEVSTGHVPQVVISTHSTFDGAESVLCGEPQPRDDIIGNLQHDCDESIAAVHNPCDTTSSALPTHRVVPTKEELNETRTKASGYENASSLQQCSKHDTTSGLGAPCTCSIPNLGQTTWNLSNTPAPILNIPEGEEFLEPGFETKRKASHITGSNDESKTRHEVPSVNENQALSTKYSSAPRISNMFDHADLIHRFRLLLSERRMEALSKTIRPHRKPCEVSSSTGLPLERLPSNETVQTVVHNLQLVPEAPTDARSLRFRRMLHTLSTMPCKWENPGLLDEALLVVPLEKIYSDAEEESQIMEAEARSLGPSKKAAWGHQDCVIRALMRWFKSSFFSWVNNPPCSKCRSPTVGVGMAHPTPDEAARGANQVELYHCSLETCGEYERFPRYNDAFVLLETRKGRVGEWSNCFGMLCRAFGARVRWIWNSEDHVWLEVYSVYRKRWVAVDVCESTWDKPLLYTSGWHRKLGYCIGFSADGCMDVTRRYVRNFARWGAERSRCSESVLLYILDEIRAMRCKNIAKSERVRIESEDLREQRELQRYIASAITAEVCKIIPSHFYYTPVGRLEAALSREKFEEAQKEAQRTQGGQMQARESNGAQGPPDTFNPDQPPES